MHPITGDTFEIRDRLKALGCTWDEEQRCWIAPDEGARAQGQALADAEPMRKWRLFCDSLAWVKGSLSAATYEAALRAASLGVGIDEVCRLAEERIAGAGSTVKPEKIKRDVKRGYDYAREHGEQKPAAGTGGTSHVFQPAPKKPEFEQSKLAKFAAPWRDKVDIAWLADRSAIDPLQTDAGAFLAALYREGERVLVLDVFASQGQWLWSHATGFEASRVDYQAWDGRDRKHESPPPLTGGEAWDARGPSGVWYLSNPISGEFHRTAELDKWDRPKWSRRSEPSVTDWRYFVIESDAADLRDWTAAMVQLPMPIAAIYTSAGASVHVLVKVDAQSKAEVDLWRQTALRVLPVLGGDPGVMTAVRLTRLPGCHRLADKDGNVYAHPREQRLLYLCPDPVPVPIVQRDRVRDTLRPWLTWAEATIGCSDRTEIDPADVTRLAAGLSRFSNCTAAREALAELRRWAA